MNVMGMKDHATWLSFYSIHVVLNMSHIDQVQVNGLPQPEREG